jgi:hypothetical protein
VHIGGDWDAFTITSDKDGRAKFEYLEQNP